MDLTTRVNLVRSLSKTDKKEIPVSVAAELCDINRTSIYYKGREISEEELICKRIIDEIHTENPSWGARQMSAQLKLRGYHIGRKKARRYMNEMAIDPIYPKMNLSKRQKYAEVVPYLLRNAVITRPNQAWSIDITYIPMKHGFLYLTAIIDWASRCIVGWELDDTLDTRAVIEACKKAFHEYKQLLKDNSIKQSMDGKSRWADNIMIERWFRTLKYDEVYLTEYANIKEARAAIGKYIYKYNFERCHSAVGNVPPASVYYPAMLYDDALEAVGHYAA